MEKEDMAIDRPVSGLNAQASTAVTDEAHLVCSLFREGAIMHNHRPFVLCAWPPDVGLASSLIRDALLGAPAPINGDSNGHTACDKAADRR